ncbi:SsrA-binding protein SmpB [Microaceticoccus formicicus]|uniref:SsrA-binding protein SmpB n=1 Tax=Microaceticoccus formicicus TaxID=3118105 RepID=UPI003CD01509|nr:SsrA-binding protein SmpB [Peptoniphilaceae bacterium AMB_02]
MSKEKGKNRVVANNRKARHEYFIEDIYEAGIVLSGTEVKSIRQGKVSIKEAFCTIVDGEMFIQGMHISPYDHGNIYNLDPVRTRKLLLHKAQINKLFGQVTTAGYTIVPLSVNIREGLVKIDIALVKGKKLYDKRETQAKKDAQRRIDRALKEY